MHLLHPQGWLFDEQLNSTRKDANGNMKDDLAAPWFYKESPDFYNWIRSTYMYHQLGQAAFFFLWGGMPYLIWGFVIRILFTMHMTWCATRRMACLMARYHNVHRSLMWSHWVACRVPQNRCVVTLVHMTRMGTAMRAHTHINTQMHTHIC